ncbi:MAG: PKD domain-containing protein [Actinomycetales bacterium]
MKTHRLYSLFTAAVIALGGVAAAVAPAQAVNQPIPGHTTLVPGTPRTGQPRITGGEIWDIEVVGNRVFVAGGFTSLANTTGNTATVNQAFLAAYDYTTGQIDTRFRPVFGGGGVSTVEASPDGTRLYVGGSFNSVNGVTKRKIAQLDLATGAPVAAFKANANAVVNQLEVSDTTVYAGGRFTGINGTPMVGLAAVNSSTGAVDTGFDNQLSGGLGSGGTLTVQGLKLTPDNSRLIVAHTGRRVAGQDRLGVAIIDTASKQLLPWRTRLYDDNLQFVGGVQRVYALDVSPDGSYFAVGSGSGGDRPPLNDTVLAFDVAGGDNMQPKWIARFFDSVYSIGISEQAVYVGGHLGFAESQTSSDPFPGLPDVGYGTGQGLGAYALGDEVVRREHVAALDPSNGKALEWNPGSNSFEGNKAMKATARGLFTGGDGNIQGGVRTGRVAFYDLAQYPAPTPTDTTITTPVDGRVVATGEQYTISGTGISPAGSTVSRVQVEIINGSGRYLQDDLVTWGTANTINATLGAQAGRTRSWSLPVTFATASNLTVRARAVASDGSRDPSKDVKKIETFSFGDQPPATAISGPTGVQTSTTFQVTGTATDDVGVSAVNYLLRNDAGLYVQDDGSLAPVYHTFRIVPDVVGARSATWRADVTVPDIGSWDMVATAVDTAGQPDIRGVRRTWLVDPTAVAPSVTITAPAAVNPPTTTNPIHVAVGAPITFSGTATDTSGLRNVEVRLQNTSTRETLAADGTWSVDSVAGWHRITALDLAGNSTNWSWTTPFNLTPGSYSFTVRATDDSELSTASTLQGRLTLNAGPAGDLAPDTLLSSVLTEQNIDALHLNIDGSATDDLGVAGVKFTLRDSDTGRYVQRDGTMAAGFAMLDGVVAAPGATSTPISLSVDLPAQGNYTVTAIAQDTAGQLDPNPSGASRRYLVYPGDADPYLNESLAQPTEGQSFTEGKIVVSGRAEDDKAMQAVQVAVMNSANQYLQTNGSFSSTERWINAYLNSPGSPGSNYSYTSPALPAGSYVVRVRAMDGYDQLQQVSRDTTVTVSTPQGNNPPVAAFTASCTNGNNCTFDARSSSDETASTLTYAWNFGNGRTGTGAVPTHVYTSAGTFTVTLVATDEFGASSSPVIRTVTISEPPNNAAPVANPGVPSCTALACNVNATGSTDPNLGDSLSFRWDFGDGTSSTSSATSKAYSTAGTYTMTLTVTDGWGKSSTATTTVTVTG